MRDMRDLSAGIAQSLEQLYDELVSFDARKLGMAFALPFFVFQGHTDAVTPTAKAKEQFLNELVQHVRPFARSCPDEPLVLC